MKTSYKAKLSQQFQFALLIIIGISLSPFMQLKFTSNHSQQNLSSFDANDGSSTSDDFNYKILGKVEAIHQVGETPEVEILNLNRGGNLKIEKFKLCNSPQTTNESLGYLFSAEQSLKLLWRSKKTGKLVKISYKSPWDRCIYSVRMVEAPSN